MQLLALLALLPYAHSGGSSSALLLTPHDVGELADDRYEVTWTDADMRFGESVVTFDLRYTPVMPPTTIPGVIPSVPQGGYIAVAIDEADLANRVVWDTRGVPAGSYFVWAIPTEDPPDMPLTLVTFSRGVVTVRHPGDVVHPAVSLPEPSVPFSRASGALEIEVEAFDPTGTASVTVEASPRRDGTGFVLIANEVPASARLRVRWELGEVAPGAWTLRATIRDARGLSFTAYARYFVEVVAPEIDAGLADASEAEDAAASDASEAEDAHERDASAYDASATDAGSADASVNPVVPQSGCGCGATDGTPWAILLLALRRRQGISSAPTSIAP